MAVNVVAIWLGAYLVMRKRRGGEALAAAAAAAPAEEGKCEHAGENE